MTFEQLKYFVQAYQLRSISLAADSLHISRQVLSRSLNNLEKELNISLFQRSVSGVMPTEAGKILYHSAVKILNEQTYAQNKLNSLILEKSQKQRIRIAIPESFMKVTGNSFSDKIATEYPDTFFNVKLSKKEKQRKFYLDNEITIFALEHRYAYKEKLNDRFTLEFLFDRPLYIWIAKTHPLNKLSTPISFSQLKHYPFCILKNSFNGVDFADLLYSKENPFVDTEQSFRSLIYDFGYFTIDCAIGGTFFFSNVFDDRFILKKTDETMYYYVIYRNDMKYSLINFIKNYFESTI